MSSDQTPFRQTARSLPIALLRARETVMGPFREMLAESGISEQKWRVLRVLAEGGPMEQTAIAKGACLLLPSLTRILAAMEKEGFVRRVSDTRDRRRTIVQLDDAGKTLIAQHADISNRIMTDLEKRFGAKRLENLLDLLEDLHELDI